MMYIDILQSCVNPTWTIGLSKHNNIRGSTIMFNASSRTCDLERFSIRNQFAKAFKAVAYQMTNFSLICPLPAGRYMIGPRMDRIKSIFPLRLFYQPNTITSIHMRFYDQVPTGNFTFWAELLFIGQVRIDCWTKLNDYVFEGTMLIYNNLYYLHEDQMATSTNGCGANCTVFAFVKYRVIMR